MKQAQDHFEVFPWSQHFNTGLNKIDEQHQQLVAQLNHLAYSLVQGDTPDIEQPFEALAHYACTHFADEEKVWAEYFQNDDWFLAHQQSHSSFELELEAIKQQSRTITAVDAIEEIIHFLVHWLASHILFEDRRMAIALQKELQGTPKTQAKKDATQILNNLMRDLISSILSMYDDLASRTLSLIREQKEHCKTQEQLRQLNQKLEKLTITDALTGLYNRRHFESISEAELKRAARYKTPLTLMLIDLDHFKQLNDHYGHSAGDHALQKIGQCLNDLCRRPTDFCFRIGGEELAVICSNQNAASAHIFAEALRSKIKELAIPNHTLNHSSSLTASIGVHTRSSSSNTNIEQMFNKADTALYSAKNSGRNKVVSNSSEGSSKLLGGA